MFRTSLPFAFPLVAFGWFIPLGLLNRLRGWQLAADQVATEPTSRRISIASIFVFTFVVSLCFFVLQFGAQESYIPGLIGMLAGIVLGTVFSIAIYLMMKLPLAFSMASYITIGAGTFFVARQLMLAAGAGPMASGNALFLSSFVFALLSGFAVARCFGVVLVTSLPEKAS